MAMAIIQNLSGAILSPYRWMRRRLTSREDSEHVQGLIRVLFGLITLAYVVSIVQLGFASYEVLRYPILLASLNLVFSVALFTLIVVAPRVSSVRRFCGTLLDITALTAFLDTGGAFTACWYPVYLWITLGNGLRYGQNYLFASGSAQLRRLRLRDLQRRLLGRPAVPLARPAPRPHHHSRLRRRPPWQADQGEGPGRGGQPGQEPLPRQHEPRAAHAAQRHHRHERSSERRAARSRAAGHGVHDSRLRALAALAHRRHPRPREDRGGQGRGQSDCLRPPRDGGGDFHHD